MIKGFLVNENLYSIEIEQSVLCILMTVIGADEFVEALKEDDFFSTRHINIFKHIKKLQSDGRGYDVEVVTDSIRKGGFESKEVSENYIFEIYQKSNGNVKMIHEYVKTLQDYSCRRALFNAGDRIKVIASDITQYTSIDAVSQSESVLAELESNADSATLFDAYDVSVDLFASINKRIEARQSGKEIINGVRTGFSDLDSKLGTISKSDLVIIAARPSMGKTAIAQSFMINISFMQQHPVLFQSAEMSKDKIGARLVASLASINLRDIRDATIPDDRWEYFLKATEKLKASKLLIDDKSKPSLSDIRRNCRRMKVKYGYVGAVFVDYLTLMRSPIKTDNNHLAVGAISKGLKSIAKEFDCPVFCLAQLNRSIESRKDRRPLMSDIRESGSIEEDADIVMFIYRDEYYDKTTKDAGIAEIGIAKARDGEVGVVRLATELQYSRFSNLELSQFYED